MLPSMLYIFIPLFVGYVIPVKDVKHIHRIGKVSSYLVYVILFFMGLAIADMDNLAANFNQILIITAVFFTSITLCNLICLPLLDIFSSNKSTHHKNTIRLSKMMMESLNLVLVVVLGVVIGLSLSIDSHWVEKGSEYVLFFLLFLIGIQLGNSGISLKQILLNKKGISIAIIVLFSSLVGGLIAAYFLGIPYHHGLAMASGFGWYSLAGILMGDALGPIYGSASFLIELSREILAIILIPITISRYSATAIGYAGATALDFTLPIIQSSGGVTYVPIAIVSGFILSFLVPILMLFFVSL